MYSEHTLQHQCVKWYKGMIPPDVPELVDLLFSIPNGADVSNANRGRLTSEGLRPGFPDLGFNQVAGKVLYFELKRPTTRRYNQKTKRWVIDQEGGKLSPDQVRIHAMLHRMGHTVIMIDNIQDFATVMAPLIYQAVQFYRSALRQEGNRAG